MKTLADIRPWPIMVIVISALALGVPLLTYPTAEHRPRAALHIDCPEKAKKKRTDWGWDVFNGRARKSRLYRL